ncbi:fused PTS fructose transporter subunit IIA/HPr protein [Haemophilus haemolyticus]|nr:fused PTS fructose transporter subunit IIA/HPr protein [Haemophilus haemolyticus]
MLELSESNIHLNANAADKQQAIEMVASALVQADNVENGYLQGMLVREQQTSTFLGNGIAIPHGTLDTRSMVKKTGVQVFQFPQGIEWGEGNIAYVVIGIAARSDEHLSLLRQLTHVLSDEDTAARLAKITDIAEFRAILMGETIEPFEIPAANISLDVDTQSLLTLVAINAGQLQVQSAVENRFISEVINNAALPLGKGLWVTDSVVGNVKNALAFSRAKTIFSHNGKAVKGVITVAAVSDQINPTLARLLDDDVQTTLLNGNSTEILTALLGSSSDVETQSVEGAVVGTFTIRNEHGLHARPSANLVNEVKKFTSKITVQNLARESEVVSAKSLMKIVALGVMQGHRLRFVADGEDAKQAIEALGKVIADGLGENVSAVPPSEPDTIEIMGEQIHAPAVVSEDHNLPANAIEAVFVIKNEHGLHARPSAVLVNEVKKYNASVAVQNLDRNSQLVSAKSLMKIVALGVVKGTRLRFVATGDEAQQAIDGIGAVIESGLGE